jgi:hypothetical protein
LGGITLQYNNGIIVWGKAGTDGIDGSNLSDEPLINGSDNYFEGEMRLAEVRYCSDKTTGFLDSI